MRRMKETNVEMRGREGECYQGERRSEANLVDKIQIN